MIPGVLRLVPMHRFLQLHAPMRAKEAANAWTSADQYQTMNSMRTQLLSLLTILAVATACSAPPPASASTLPSITATSITVAPSAKPTAASPATRGQYVAKGLFELHIHPTAIAASASEVYVAEVALGARMTNTLSKVVVVSLGGGAPTTVAGSETPASVSINGLAFHDNALYMSTASNGPTRLSGVFRLAGGTSTPVVAGPGAPADLHGNGDGGPALSAVLQGPASLAFSTVGDLYIAEFGDSRIRVVRAQTITTFAGGNGVGGYGAIPTGSATTAKLGSVGLIAVDPDGVVYAASQSFAGKWIARIDSSGALSTISSSFSVSGLAIDVNGDLLAADGDGDRIVRFPRAHPDQPSVVIASLGHIVALATGPDGSVYVAKWHRPDPTRAVSYTITRLVPLP